MKPSPLSFSPNPNSNPNLDSTDSPSTLDPIPHNAPHPCIYAYRYAPIYKQPNPHPVHAPHTQGRTTHICRRGHGYAGSIPMLRTPKDAPDTSSLDTRRDAAHHVHICTYTAAAMIHTHVALARHLHLNTGRYAPPNAIRHPAPCHALHSYGTASH